MERHEDHGRLIIASNRLPYKVSPSSGSARRQGAGGLVTALEPLLEERGGQWIGWEGSPGPAGRSFQKLPVEDQSGGYEIGLVPLSEHDVDNYYGGFSNRTLWPLFHSFLDRTRISRDWWLSYQKVNRRFSRILSREAAPQDMVWIHDYHLCLVPGHLRELRPELATLFFLHVPFPAYEVFRILPWRQQLLEGLLGADVVGFHTRSYVMTFLECVRKILGYPVDFGRQSVKVPGRQVIVRAAPISVDVGHFRRLCTRRCRRPAGEQIIILGVDRLDYTKGIPERLLAIERLLEKYPRYQHRVTFVQIAVPSRSKVEEYRALKRRIDETVGRINGRFTEGGWSPVRYIYRFLPHEQLVDYYRQAHVALLTPLRDGMNLVAKEYVICHPEEGGALILSELAGASEELTEALVVNPYDIEGVAERIHWAIQMPAEEKRRRMTAMKQQVESWDVRRWATSLLAMAGRTAPREPETMDGASQCTAFNSTSAFPR
jgi:trehalose 6-phosphate synthase/phosphatase